MGRYIGWDDIVNKYQHIKRIGGAGDISSHYITYAEAEVDGRLAGFFTTPFSDNNITAKDLAIDVAYSRMSILKDEDYKDFISMLDTRFDRLKSGDEYMITNSTDTIVTTTQDNYFYSTTQDYNNVFGRDEYEYSSVSSTELQAEIDARN